MRTEKYFMVPNLKQFEEVPCQQCKRLEAENAALKAELGGTLLKDEDRLKLCCISNLTDYRTAEKRLTELRRSEMVERLMKK